MKKTQNLILMRIKLLLGLKLFGGSLYLKAVLKRIEVTKSLLMLEVEQGREVYIPKDMS